MAINKFIRQVGKFGFVGIIANVVHIAIFTLLRSYSLDEQLSNLGAFACAFNISWVGHYFWTFQSGGKRSFLLFLCVALVGYGINAFLVWLIITTYQLPDYYAMAGMVSITPLITFILSKFWAFRAT